MKEKSQVKAKSILNNDIDLIAEIPRVIRAEDSLSDECEESETENSGDYVSRPVTLDDLDEGVLKYLADNSQKISNAEKKVYDNFNNYLKQNDKKILETINFINKEFKKDSRQNARFMENIRIEFNQETVIRKREKNDFMNEMQQVAKKVKDTHNIIHSFIQDFEKISDIVACLLEDVQIQQTLDIQDELDKKDISLFGVAQKQKKFNFHDAIHAKEDDFNRTLDHTNIENLKARPIDNLTYKSNIISLDKN